MTNDLKQLAISAVLIGVVGSASWSLSQAFFGKVLDIDFLVGITAFSIAVVTFFGVIKLNRSAQDQALLVEGERLRTAMACSLVITYLYIVCFTTFVKNAASVGKVTETFVESFSNVIGITIAFYFGASAAAQIFANKNNQTESKSSEQQK